MCDRCHDTPEAGLWGYWAWPIGSWLTGSWAAGLLWLQVPVHHAFRMTLQFESTETRAQATDLRSHPLKRCCPC